MAKCGETKHSFAFISIGNIKNNSLILCIQDYAQIKLINMFAVTHCNSSNRKQFIKLDTVLCAM